MEKQHRKIELLPLIQLLLKGNPKHQYKRSNIATDQAAILCRMTLQVMEEVTLTMCFL